MIDQYLVSKANSWAASTLRSERHRLQAMSSHLTGDPNTLWEALASQAPYTRVTSWTRATAYWDYLLDAGHTSGPNPYKAFKRANARLFKNVYSPSHPKMSYQEAAKLVKTISNVAARRLALRMLGEGTRYSEAIQVGDLVVGKGSYTRRRFSPDVGDGGDVCSYALFREALAAKGLKPHDLRKLCASRLAQAGLKEADLLKAMGWRSMETAKYYLQPKRDEELRQVFDAIQEDLK